MKRASLEQYTAEEMDSFGVFYSDKKPLLQYMHSGWLTSVSRGTYVVVHRIHSSPIRQSEFYLQYSVVCDFLYSYLFFFCRRESH